MMSALDPEWQRTSNNFRYRNILIGLILLLSRLKLIPIKPRHLS
jgi:hypothetical protein